MTAMNAQAKLDTVPEDQVAARFLAGTLGITAQIESEGMIHRLVRHAGEHLTLVAISLLAGIVVAIPLGILAARKPTLGRSSCRSSG